MAPAELEDLLLQHPAIADSAVIPVPSEEAGEIPKAFVVLKPNAKATAEEIMEFIAEKVHGTFSFEFDSGQFSLKSALHRFRWIGKDFRKYF